MTALPHKESTRKPSPAPASGPAPPEAMMEALTADRIGGTMAGESKDGRVILALDQGTTSARAIVFAADGGVLSLAQREIGLDFPQPGWVEQDPLEIWTAQRETAAEALQSSGVAVTDVAGIGVTNQRETTIVWDRATSLPIAPAIVWQDRRTAERCEELRRAGHEALVRRKTGLVLDPYFSATKIRWLLDSVPGARERAARGELAFGTVDSWLAWQLSGGRLHVTDATNASRTLLYDLRAGDWDDELLELFGVPRALLPRVCDTSGVVGQTDAGVFGAPLPLAALVGDQQAALFGQACTARGMTKVTYGTGCFLLMNTGEELVESRSGLLGTVALQCGGRRTYALEGSVFIGGAAIQWLRDGLGIIAEARDSAALAARVPASDGVYFVPALATLEGIAFQVADLLGAVAGDAGVAPADVRADGGASHNDLLLQFQADVLGVPVTRAAQTESTALGAALLAGLAVGLWKGEREAADLWRAERTFAPDPAADREALLVGWRAAVACVRALAGRTT